MSNTIVAPMPGIVTTIKVKVGDQIKVDDEVLLLEAMKMENPIYSPYAGKVREIKVGEKAKVSTNQELIVLE